MSGLKDSIRRVLNSANQTLFTYIISLKLLHDNRSKGVTRFTRLVRWGGLTWTHWFISIDNDPQAFCNAYKTVGTMEAKNAKMFQAANLFHIYIRIYMCTEITCTWSSLPEALLHILMVSRPSWHSMIQVPSYLCCRQCGGDDRLCEWCDLGPKIYNVSLVHPIWSGQVLWDAGMAGNTKADVITACVMDKHLLMMCFPQAWILLAVPWARIGETN